MDKQLLEKLGINPDQVQSNGKELPPHYIQMITEAEAHCFDVLCGDFNGEECHWKIPYKVVEQVFKEYTFTGTYQSVRWQLGRCSYKHKTINLNFGNSSMDKDQTWRTLLHEIVHAVLYVQYGCRQNHNFRFKFYLHLLTPLSRDKQV